MDTEARLVHLEESLKAIPRMEQKLDIITELAGAIQLCEERQRTQGDHLGVLFQRMDRLREQAATNNRELYGHKAAIRATLATATLFWVLLQGGIGFVLQDTVETVAKNHDAVVRMEQRHNMEEMKWQTSTLPKE